MLAFIPLLALPELATGITSTSNNSHTGLSLVAGLESWQAALVTLGMIALVVFGGSHLIAPLFRFVAQARLRELFTATALFFVIGIALMMSLVGLSPALGTFLAGVVLANSPYKHELESNIDPFKGLLLGLFFITVGASINFQLLTDNLDHCALTAILILTGSGVINTCQLFGFKRSRPMVTGARLAQAGNGLLLGWQRGQSCASIGFGRPTVIGCHTFYVVITGIIHCVPPFHCPSKSWRASSPRRNLSWR